MSRRAPVLVCTLIAILLAHGARAQEAWSYEIAPYLWAASLSGREGVGGSTADVSADFSDLIEFVNTGASMRFTAHREPVTWFAEASYVELDDSVGTAAGELRVTSAQTFAEMGLSYELNSALAVYGGLRYQKLDLKLEVAGTRVSGDEDWIDGMIGVRWLPIPADRWVAWVRADVGGGGSDLVWLAEAGGGYRWGTRWGAYLAYRVLDTDYEQGGFLYDIQQRGFLLGFGLRF